MAEKDPGGTRLNKFISDTGFCSRREADKLIENGSVTVNGKKAGLGLRVKGTETIKIHGKNLEGGNERIYLAFNKPVGVTCTTETHVQGNIITYLNLPMRIFPVGRLDKPSEGLIFLTNDGDIVNKILRAGNNHEKEYVVAVDKPITEDFIQKMSNGVPIVGTVTKKCFVKKEDKNVFTIILTQGLNRQIRRMCEHLGYTVTRLRRVRIMNVTLNKIPPGEYRELTESELRTINAMIKDSSKTEEASLTKDDNHYDE